MLFIGSLLVIVLLAIVVWLSSSTLFVALGSFVLNKINWFKKQAEEENLHERK